MSRNKQLEDKILDELQRVAEGRFGIDTGGLADRVRGRLALGAERYGDTDYLEKDVIAELVQEPEDTIAYGLLQTNKVLSDPNEEGSQAWHLFEAMIGAAYSDYHARAARRAED